jgi:transcriptional regulator GlxA family with amidase domain
MPRELSEVIALLQPRTVFSKRISGAGRWGVRYSDFGQPSFCAVLEGGCRLAVDGHRALTLEAGDFVLLPATPAEDAPPGLLRGLADARLAPAMKQMHGQLARSWTIAQLAKKVALSRSAFFERFTRTVGLSPMEYLVAWRMAVAKDLLRRQDLGLADVAERVGYRSASTFSTAFSRHVGQPPRRYARER